MNFTVINSKRLATETSAVLRQLADDVDEGLVGAIIVGAVRNGEYEMHKFSSMTDSLVLANLLHDSALEAFKA